MTLAQLNAFVLVARLGSVTAAAKALGVSEPAVSQALSALRQHHDDPLLTRGAGGMTLTPGGSRLLPIASQMIALNADAECAVRQVNGSPDRLKVAVTSTIGEFLANPLLAAFTERTGNSIDVTASVAKAAEMAVLVANRLVDIAIGPRLDSSGGQELDTAPVFRTALVAVGSQHRPPRGSPPRWNWLVDPAGTDSASDTSRLLRRLGVPDEQIQVFANQSAAAAAAAGGTGVSIAIEHLVTGHLQRHELQIVATRATPMPVYLHVTSLPRDRRSDAANSLRHFLGTPAAMRVLRAPGSGVRPSRFRPPVHVTLWS